LDELGKQLKEEHEKVLMQNLRAKEEEALSSRVEQQIREMQEKLRREKHEQELLESRSKAENQLKDLERRLAEERAVGDAKAPKFDGEGKKTGNAVFVKVELNGQVIHENVEMKGPTPGGLTGKEAPTGPIMYQGDHGIVSFRNLKVTPVK